MPIHTQREYAEKRQAEKKPPIQSRKTEPVLERGPAPLSITEKETYVLQDPEMRTFSDQVTVKGRLVVRECQNGTLKTTDPDLRDNLVEKGWLLQD